MGGSRPAGLSGHGPACQAKLNVRPGWPDWPSATLVYRIKTRPVPVNKTHQETHRHLDPWGGPSCQRRPQHLPRGGAKHTRGAQNGRGLRYFSYASNRLTLDCNVACERALEAKLCSAYCSVVVLGIGGGGTGAP